MPIHNINTIQNPNDIEKLTRLSDQQLLQSLANLGQRFGIKGDCVAYGSFKFSDVLDVDIVNTENQIGILNYYYNSEQNCIYSELGITSADEKYVHSQKVLSLNTDDVENIFDQQYLLSTFVPETKINNIDYYTSNSMFNKDGYIVKSLLFGKILGTTDSESNNIEVQYNEYNLDTNELNRAIRSYYLYSTSETEHYYILLDFERKVDNDGQVYYNINVYILNSKNIYDEYTIDITKLYSLSDLNATGSFKNISDKYINIFNKRDDGDEYAFALFNLFMNYDYSMKYKDIEVAFDTQTNKLIYENNDELKYIEDILNNSTVSIYDRISYINLDITYLLPQLIQLYNDHAFNTSKSTLYKHIIYALYENILNEYNIDEKYVYEFPVLYIPLNQKIYYMHNDKNEFEVYFSNNIYINHVDFSTLTLTKIREILASQIFVFDYSPIKENTKQVFESKQCVYQIQFNYNDKYKHVVNSVDITNVYTLPYINAKNNWVINGGDSGVLAKAHVQNDQTLLIIENYYESDDTQIYYDTLNASVLNASPSFTVLFDDTKNVTAYNKDYSLEYHLPVLNELNYSYFSDILVVLLSDMSCLIKNNGNHKTVSEDHSESKLCTFWQAGIDDNGDYKFSVLSYKSGQKTVLTGKDLFNITDIKNEIIDSLDENNNIFDRLIFDIDSIKNYNQSDDTNNTYLRGSLGMLDPILYKDSVTDKYLTSKDVTLLDYNNNLNMILGVYPDSTFDKYYIDDSKTGAHKFITTIKNNIIHPSLYYGKQLNKTASKDTVKPVQYTEEMFSDGNVNIVINDDDNDITLTDEIKKQYTTYTLYEIVKNVTNSVTDKYDFYKEYDFDTDVPEFDLREFITKNISVLNRMNILSIDKAGSLFNAYIGVSPHEENKNELLITTSPININMGNGTMIDRETATKFNSHDVLRLLFPRVVIDAPSIEHENNGITINHHTHTPFNTELNVTPKTLDIASLVDVESNIDCSAKEVDYNTYCPCVNLSDLFKFSDITINDDETTDSSSNSDETSESSNNATEPIITNRLFLKFKDSTTTSTPTALVTDDYIFLNIAYILRQHNILTDSILIKSIIYNNNTVIGPENINDSTEKISFKNTHPIHYTNDNNSNILLCVDKDKFITYNDQIFNDSINTIIINESIKITYWIKSNELTLVINDGGLGISSDTDIYIYNQVSSN